jgi:hypothetical protein
MRMQVVPAMYTLRNLRRLALFGAVVSSAFAAQQSWTGQISDNKCGVSHNQMIEAKYKELKTNSAEPDRDCTLACMKEKGTYVFVTGGSVYKIANQNLPALRTHAGHNVQLTGDLQGDTIKVSRVTLAPKK